MFKLKLENGSAFLAISSVVLVATGCSGPNSQATKLSHVPKTVFDGGAGSMAIRLENSQPAELIATFAQYNEMGDSKAKVSSRELLKPGNHSYSIDVSPDTYLYLELQVHDPSEGAEIGWVILLDGHEVRRASDRLNEPLPEKYAFFIQFEADDIDEVRSCIQ